MDSKNYNIRLLYYDGSYPTSWDITAFCGTPQIELVKQMVSETNTGGKLFFTRGNFYYRLNFPRHSIKLDNSPDKGLQTLIELDKLTGETIELSMTDSLGAALPLFLYKDTNQHKLTGIISIKSIEPPNSADESWKWEGEFIGN